jgi:hypothetical protein
METVESENYKQLHKNPFYVIIWSQNSQQLYDEGHESWYGVERNEESETLCNQDAQGYSWIQAQCLKLLLKMFIETRTIHTNKPFLTSYYDSSLHPTT